MADVQKYPLRFSIEFPENGQPMEQYEQLKIPKMYEMAKKIINEGGYVVAKTVFINGEAQEMKISKMIELRDLFGKV